MTLDSISKIVSHQPRIIKKLTEGVHYTSIDHQVASLYEVMICASAIPLQIVKELGVERYLVDGMVLGGLKAFKQNIMNDRNYEGILRRNGRLSAIEIDLFYTDRLKFYYENIVTVINQEVPSPPAKMAYLLYDNPLSYEPFLNSTNLSQVLALEAKLYIINEEMTDFIDDIV